MTTEPHPSRLPIDRLLRDCQLAPTRRTGPGGQRRNKVETAIVITHQPTGVTAEASERRSQAENRRVAIRRLRMKLARGSRCTHETPPPPSELWRQRRRGRAIQVSATHDDFAALLSESLDVLHHFEHRTSDAAEHLGLSTSQLIGLFRKDPETIQSINRHRQHLGLKPLR